MFSVLCIYDLFLIVRLLQEDDGGRSVDPGAGHFTYTISEHAYDHLLATEFVRSIWCTKSKFSHFE